MSLHKEISFEDEVCEYLKVHDWLYSVGDATDYDRARALFPTDVLGWVQATQPTVWETLTKNHGSKAAVTVLDRLRAELNLRGTLDVLRNGIDLLGLKEPLRLAQFKPSLAMNPDVIARYQANRLRVIRQVHYSLNNQNALDLVLFLNGVPVATVELKTDFTQSVADAIAQYRYDRVPHPKGQAAEPLLSFPNGALVHFAVSNSEVHMTTKLEGGATAFLPFNQGNEGGAGNPPNPNGHPTAFLWERVWARESWLEILGRYLIAKRDKKKQITNVLFPRFHQLDVTRKLQTAVLKDPPGTKYLVQHSAGSGKTNSIAWTAHFFAELHDAAIKKVFDSVIVVSDRNVIDDQLQEAIFDFERTTGVVATITGEAASKSGELAEALSGAKKIVVCTIQTFPFALKAVRELAATKGKRFAVIADEAHSSQAGTAASNLKLVLSAAELAEVEDGGEVSGEDILAAQMAARADDNGITFVAFTATPKNKTMELFGTRPDPSRKPAPDNVPTPFHVYSMRQAIEEKFILDVLKNYTSYSLAFKLAQEGKEVDEREVERSAAVKKIMNWVKLHPVNVSQKVQIVVEHYRDNVAGLLSGKAKAMVVVSSRREAVKWKLAIEKYIKERGYQIGTLVAFSGEVFDEESGPGPFTEHSPSMNPKLKGDIRKAFEGGEYQVLLVANKFQTGFDQPLLCGMYVDKRLAGIQAVQTLSRLNRAYPGKDTTFVLDFVNEPNEVLEAFKLYFTTAELATTTDPNLVFNLKAKLDAAGHYDEFEVDRVANVVIDPKSKQGDLIAAVTPVVDRLMKRFKLVAEARRAAKEKGDPAAVKEAQSELDAFTLLKSDMTAFVRLYTFLSQIFDYGSTGIEKRALFYKAVLPLLEFGREREEIDLSQVKLSHYSLRDRGIAPMVLGEGKPKLEPLTEAGSGSVQERQKAKLAVIIEKLNELFEGELSEGDQLVYVLDVVKGKLLESATLVEQASNNSKEQFGSSPDLTTEILNAVIAALDAHTAMSTQALNSERVRDGIKDVLLNHGELWESLRAKAAGG
ncbi:MAG: type I restriction endonuclease subunit R [Archangiaceae bacterium]|nr:type I restriction endonuclease subunit R [Archangiaceae bacterium]